MKNQRMMRIAYKNIDKSQCNHYKVSAVLVHGCNICSTGTNLPKTHPLQKDQYHRFDCGNSTHAELNCLLKAPYETIKGSTMYVCRKIKNGNFSLAKPCYLCEALLRLYGIKKVIYSIGPTENDLGILEL